jgi:hypothetical protein
VTDIRASASGIDGIDSPFTVAVREDHLLILGRNGSVVPMTIAAARRSAQRMLDAIEVAGGHMPTSAIDPARYEPAKLRA